MPRNNSSPEARRALRHIQKYLLKEKKTLTAQALFKDFSESPSKVTLDGYGPFDRALGVRPELWLIPDCGRDWEDLLCDFEAYVDRPLGKVRRPDIRAREHLHGASWRRYFGEPRKPREWWVPAVKLLALVYRKVGGEVTIKSPGHVVLEHETWKAEVTPTGGWMPWGEKFVPAAWRASDADIAHLRTPMLTTEHPLAAALVSLQAPRSVLWAANTVVRAQESGRFEPLEMVDLEVLKSRPRPPVRKSRVSDSEAAGAVEVLRDALDFAPDLTVIGAYRALVPHSVTGVEFTEAMGNPFSSGNRPLTKEMRSRLLCLLDRIEERIGST